MSAYSLPSRSSAAIQVSIPVHREEPFVALESFWRTRKSRSEPALRGLLSGSGIAPQTFQLVVFGEIACYTQVLLAGHSLGEVAAATVVVAVSGVIAGALTVLRRPTHAAVRQP